MISSKQNREYKYLYSLHQKKYRDQAGQYLIEGFKLVEEALVENLLIKIIVEEGREDYFPAKEVEKLVLSKKLFKDLSRQVQPEGLMALCKKKEEKEIVNSSILYLDRIRDPGNLGTMIRSAEAFGFGVMISDESVDLYNEKVLRASMGSIFRVPIQTKVNIEDLLKKKEMGYSLIATSLSGEEGKLEALGRTVLMIGNESHGLAEKYLTISDRQLKIPMQGQVESLNAAISASILMYILQAK